MTPKIEKDNAMLRHPVIVFCAEHPVAVGLALRLFLAWFLPWLMDDGKFLPNVAYTDIDFLVFTDAAKYIQLGQSPYDRHTYRYTPFLAELLAQLPHPQWGRYLFCFADGLCGWIIIRFRRRHAPPPPPPQQQQQQQQQQQTTWKKLQDALWWCYNPLAINICTRGSAESFMVLLPVLLTFHLVTASHHGTTADDGDTVKVVTHSAKSHSNKLLTIPQAIIAGISHGIAIHSKLYPIIYSLSYMAYLAAEIPNHNHNNNNATTTTMSQRQAVGFPWTDPKRLFRLIVLWTRRLFSPIPLIFLISALTTFAGVTYLAVVWYGDIALQEGLLYHFSRVDHRHNYSMYWYWIYLEKARTDSSNLAILGRLLLLPQIILLVYSSLGIAPYNLGLALFLQTYLFVTHNKVITAQYFTWYLCLLPLCSDSFHFHSSSNDHNHHSLFFRRVPVALAGLGISILFWLGTAYCLEMQGMSVHKLLWIASVVYFLANVNLMGALLQSCRLRPNESPLTPTTTSFASVSATNKKKVN